MDRTIVDRTVRWVVLSSLFLSWEVASADPWDFGLNIDLGVIYTDNIFLAAEGLEESETAYTIAPEFVLSKDSERLQADLRYRPEAYFYSEFDDANDVYHVLDASLLSVLLKNKLFLALTASSLQTIVTPEGRFPTTNLPITRNRVDSRTFEIRPYWQQRIGQVNLLVDAGFSRLDYHDELYQATDQTTGRFRVDNIESQQGLAWAFDYQYRRAEYEVSPPWEFQRASANVGFWFGGTLRIFAVGGAETSFENFLESNLDEEFWEAGFQYKPNKRLDLELAAGDRSYGKSFRGRFSYTLRRGRISASYDEGPSTRSDVGFGRRPIEDTDNLDSILDRPGESDRFVRRRGQLQANIELSKSELSVRVFAEKRDLRSTADGLPQPDEEFSGAAIRWSWDMGTKTLFGVGADIAERDQAARKDNLFKAQVDITYQITPRLSIRAEVLHSQEEGKESGARAYDENQVGLYLSTQF